MNICLNYYIRYWNGCGQRPQRRFYSSPLSPTPPPIEPIFCAYKAKRLPAALLPLFLPIQIDFEVRYELLLSNKMCFRGQKNSQIGFENLRISFQDCFSSSGWRTGLNPNLQPLGVSLQATALALQKIFRPT